MLVDKSTLPVPDFCEAIQKNGKVCARNNCKIHKAKIIVQKQEQIERELFEEEKKKERELFEEEKKKLQEERKLFEEKLQEEEKKKQKDIQMSIARAGGNPYDNRVMFLKF